MLAPGTSSVFLLLKHLHPTMLFEQLASREFPTDVNRGITFLLAAWIGAGVATLLIACRIYTKVSNIRETTWDDWILLVAGSINLLSVALSSVAVHYGLGRHIVYLTEDQIFKTLLYTAIVQPFAIAGYSLPKLVVAVLIIRLQGTERRGVYFLYSVITVLFVTSGLCAVYLFARCEPPSWYWNPGKPAQCSSPHVLQDITYVSGGTYGPLSSPVWGCCTILTDTVLDDKSRVVCVY